MILSILSWIGPPLLLILAGLMVYRKLYREFPFFFAYISAKILAEFVLVLVHKFQKTHIPYFYTYWITEAVFVLLGFLVLYEVFLVHMFPLFNTTRTYWWLFPLAGLAVVSATVWAFVQAPSKGPDKLTVLVGQFTRALNLCQVAFLIFFGGLIWYMSREWRRHELGIASGFAFYASVTLLVNELRAQHLYTTTAIDQLPNLSSFVAILIWLFFLSRKDPVPEETPITEEMAAEADRAYQDIAHLLRGKPRR